MMDAVIDEVDGRMIRIGEHWLADFASCNYLGFDLDREIIDAVPAYLDAWGTHPSWSRLLGSPVLYEQIEERLTKLLGSEDSLVLPTITHIHMSVIPLLAASGTIFLDARVHKTIYDGCQVARSRGAAVKRFRFEDPDHLDELLRAERDPTRLICMDGVNSMTGNAPDVRAFAAVAREHGALLYIDDAHGFGVIGERRPDEPCSYIVKNDLHGSAADLGIVFAAGGIGSVGCAVVLGQRGLPRRDITFMYVTWTLATFAIAGYGLATAVWQLMIASLAFNALETAGTIVWATAKQRHVPAALL
jgi:7-keto-8-aminopelargonate synthetase-like enzyme